MKKWTTPMAMEESFTANVDVAVTTCYKVACDAKAANDYEKGHYHGLGKLFNHTDANCTFSENNVIQIDSKTHKIKGMIGKYEYGEVPCQFTNSDYQAISPDDLKVNDRVYWTSPGLFNSLIGEKFHHQGYLQLTDQNKKCMS